MRKSLKKWISRMDSTQPLMENHNNNIENGHESECMVHNSLRKNKEKKSQELFSPCSDDASDDDDPSNRFEPMQSRKGSMSLTFPEIPADLDQHLHRHLENVEEIVQNKPNSRSGDNSGCLEDCFLLQTSEHLNFLLKKISTSKNCLFLINWVFERKQLFHNSESDLVEEWGTEAETKLLESIKKEVRVSLDKILQEDRNQTEHNEETYIQLYVDIIQCINAMPTYVQNVRPRLYPQVQEVCYQELCDFVKRYTSEQTKILQQKAENWREHVENPEMIHFLKTLKTCKELRNQVSMNATFVKVPLVQEINKILKDMEALTMQLLKKIVTELAETSLEDYFKSRNASCNCLLLSRSGQRHCGLFDELRNHFPRLSKASDEQKIVMDEAYKIVVHSYLKHLIQKSPWKLKRYWSRDVGQAVDEDAQELHTTISDLAPGVQQWNCILLKINDILKSNDIDGLRLDIAIISREEQRVCLEDLELLPNLLRWKGLSKREVREVLEALPRDSPISNSKTSFSSFCCCY